MTPRWTLVILSLHLIDIQVVRPDNPVTFYLPDHARKPHETTREINFDDEDEDILIWATHEDFKVDPAFDLEKATESYDMRNQVKTVFTGKISPTKTAREIQRTEPCYEKEDPMTVGLGLDQLWDNVERKGRVWESKGPSH